MLQKALWFVEDYSRYIVGGLILVIAALVAVIAFAGPDEEAIREEVTIEVVTEMISSLGPQLMMQSVQIQALESLVAQLQAQIESGNLAVSGIRPNEDLGAYSDPAGNFYCFPVES
jgi:hypothetical protein